MSTLHAFQDSPRRFGSWFRRSVRERPLPWAWTPGDASLLHAWAREEGWLSALHPGSPRDMDGAAAAFATLLAAAHEHCFRGAGDISVWARLRAVVSFRTSDVGGAVRDIAKALDLPWDTSGTEGLIHVLPFLRLAGCPSQALVPLGRLLRQKGSVHELPQRYQALCGARWPSPHHQAELARWLRDSGERPSFLQEVEADLLTRELADRPKAAPAPMLLRCLEDPKGLAFVLRWRDPAKPKAVERWWPETLPQSPQTSCGLVVDPDQAFQVSGKDWNFSWTPPEEPTGWRRTGSAALWELCAWHDAERVLLPRGWSLDGEPGHAWRLLPLAGAAAVFDPQQRPWPVPRPSARRAFASDFHIQELPGLPVLQADDLPRGLPGLEVRSGERGSSLGTSVWRGGDLERTPWGHLVLSWNSGSGRRLSRALFVVPTLEVEVLQTAGQDKPRIFLRGHGCLPGHDQDRLWYLLEPEVGQGRWQARLEMQPPEGGPLTLLLEGDALAWGGRLGGGDGSLTAFQRGPWAVAPTFLREAARAGYHMKVQVPEGRVGKLYLEDGGPLLPHVELGGKAHLQPMELALALEPLLKTLPDTARPVRVNAVWETGQTSLFRLFSSPAPVGVRLMEGSIQVAAPHGHPLRPEEWVLRAGSMVSAEMGLFQWALDELPLERPADHMVRTPWPRALAGKGAPWFLQIRPKDPARLVLPLSIHADREGRRIPVVAEAFALALKAKGIGDVPPPAPGFDQRDSLLDFLYNLAERHDLTQGFFSEAEQQHWLQFLGDDYLFSQPWTLGLTLRHPAMALAHLAEVERNDAALGGALSRLGQGTFLPWLLSRADLEELDAGLEGRLGRAVEARLGKLAECLTSPELTRNATLRHVFTQRVCEEGLPLLAHPQHRGVLMNLLDLAPAAMKEIRNWPDFERLFLGRLAEGVLKECQRELLDAPVPAPMLPKRPGVNVGWPSLSCPDHALHGMARLGAWGRSYRAWWQQGRGSLLAEKPWPDATPQIFRHHAVLMTLFTLHPLGRS